MDFRQVVENRSVRIGDMKKGDLSGKTMERASSLKEDLVVGVSRVFREEMVSVNSAR